MKKFAMILLCVALVFSCTVMAFADPSGYSVTVQNPILNQTYTPYKIFDVTYNAAEAGQAPTAYTYTISTNSQWWSALTTPNSGTVDLTANTFTVDGLTFTKTQQTAADNGTVYIVTYDTATVDTEAEREALAQTISNKLYAAVSGKTPAATAVTASSTDPITFDVGSAGYYFVTTTQGALFVLNSATPDVTVTEKNSIPGIVKKVSNDNSSWVAAPGHTNVSIGDEVYFELDITDGVGTDKGMTITDEMSTSIDLKGYPTTNDIKVFVGGTEVAAGNDTFSVTVTNRHRFVIEFAPAFVETLTPPAQGSTTPSLIVTYTGILNETAHIVGNVDDDSVTPAQEAYNTNTATLTYQNNSWPSTVTVDVYAFDIIKTDSARNIIQGAHFDVYDDYDANDATVGNKIDVVLIDTEYVLDPETGDPTTTVKSRTYRPAVDGETPAAYIEAGIAHMVGFGSGTYWFEETAAPDGYNKIDGRTQYQLGAANDYATLTDNGTKWANNGGGLHVVNETGSQMPSTGGIGTYLFYGIGAILVVGAVVVLVSKKRMHAYSD